MDLFNLSLGRIKGIGPTGQMLLKDIEPSPDIQVQIVQEIDLIAHVEADDAVGLAAVVDRTQRIIEERIIRSENIDRIQSRTGSEKLATAVGERLGFLNLPPQLHPQQQSVL